MSKRPPTKRRSDRAAFVVSSANGEVLDQNEEARHLLGDGVGLDCWQFMGVAARGDRVPCAPGCTGRLVDEHDTQSNPVMVGQKRYQLSCVPMGARTVSVLAPLDPPRCNNGGRRLSTRETEVLELMSRGFTVASIARELSISDRTVRTHVEHMRAKFGVSSQAALVAQGYERGYL